MHRSNSIESCLLAPLTKTTSGMPWASTTMCRLDPSFPLSVGFGPVSSPPGAWYRGAVNAGSAPIYLVMFTQAYQHGLMQLLPYACLIPLTQSSPACHAAAIAQSLGQVFPRDASLENKQDAVEGGFITDGAVATTFAGCNERGNEGLQLLPQLFADGGSGHETVKHKCFWSPQIEVVLAALNVISAKFFEN